MSTSRMNPDSRVVLVIAVVATVGLAITSFLLSYSGLGAAAEWARVPAWLAWAVPVTIDGAILVYTLAALVFRARGESARVAWTALAVFATLSVVANAVHAWDAAPAALRVGIGVVVAGLAPVAVLLTTHTIARLVIAPPAGRGEDVTPLSQRVTPPLQPAQDGGRRPVALTDGAGPHSLPTPIDVDERDARIRALRHTERLSYSAIAERTGVSKTTVSRVLSQPSVAAA